MTDDAWPVTVEEVARLREILDRHDIDAVLVRFARYLDEKDFQAYADLYAEDGVLTTPRATHRGRAGLAEHVERDLGGYTATHHVCASRDILLDGDIATARSSLHATHVRSADKRDFWTVGGWYDVGLRRGGARRWEITSVVINPVWRFDSPGSDESALGRAPARHADGRVRPDPLQHSGHRYA